MGKILDAFLNGELNLDGNRTPEHQKLCDESLELQEKLKARLNSEDKELLEHLVEVIMDEEAYYGQDRFARGYQLGVLMTMEVYLERDTFLAREV